MNQEKYLTPKYSEESVLKHIRLITIQVGSKILRGEGVSLLDQVDSTSHCPAYSVLWEGGLWQRTGPGSRDV